MDTIRSHLSLRIWHQKNMDKLHQLLETGIIFRLLFKATLRENVYAPLK